VAGNTPLHIAATRNYKESVKWLLLRGADPTIKNKSGKTARDLAQQAASEDSIAVLNAWNVADAGTHSQRRPNTSASAAEVGAGKKP
jgi:ankyrin repeat protein